MTYDALGVGALDYLPCRYGTSKLLFRGPRRRLEQDYVAFIGGTETYGKFIEHPFPDLIEQATGYTCVNFGFPNAGVDVFAHDPFVPSATSAARVTVIQVLGAQNVSNRYYSVHPRRNDRFVAASPLLQTIYREIEFGEYHFTKHMLTSLMTVSPDRFELVRDELQQCWVARMKVLLSRISGKTVLLWFAPRSLEQDEKVTDFGADPMFVTRDMVEAVRTIVTDVVEVVASPEALAKGTEGMVFSQMEAPAAGHIMGPAAHGEVASALSDVVARLF
ncbi:MAG: DUF6473 family protein [Paracoccaceae bacterium]